VEAGEYVVIGSRYAERPAAKLDEPGARAAANDEAVRGVDLVVLAVKADAALPTAESLVEAIGDTPVLSVASELRFTKQGVLPGEDARSIAERTQDLLRAPVVAGLHSLAAASLASGKADGDALVCGDDVGVKELALALASLVVAGRALDAGPLASARALEGMTAVIVNLNKRYRAHAGLRVTGLQ
jgi:NADPH-dependent F420 reductase